MREIVSHHTERELEAEENEPYLGPAWAAVMFVLYLLKRTFPADEYTTLWWLQNYVIAIVVAITIFTLIKRHQFYKQYKLQKKEPK